MIMLIGTYIAPRIAAHLVVMLDLIIIQKRSCCEMCP